MHNLMNNHALPFFNKRGVLSLFFSAGLVFLAVLPAVNLKAGPWTPDVITTVVWYDASDESTITSNTNGVTQLADKSGNNRHLNQSNASRQPVSGVRTLNDLNVIDFSISGTSAEYLQGGASSPTSGNMAVFVVSVIDTVTDNACAIFTLNHTGGGYLMLQANSNTRFDGLISVSGIGNNVSLTGGPFHGPSIYNVNMDFTGAGSYNAFVDGVQRAVNTTYTSTPELSNIMLFTNRGNAQRALDGAVGEMVIIEDVTEEMRQRVEGYLAWKWGLKANLSPDHPYRHKQPWDGPRGTLITLR